MGQAFSALVGWILSKLSTTPSPSSPQQYDVDIHSIEGYAHDPELGVASLEEAAATNAAGSRDNTVEHGGYDFGASASKKVKWIGQYNSSQKILLVGEGDFSFSASLALAFGDASNIVATSLDSLGISYPFDLDFSPSNQLFRIYAHLIS